MGQRETAGTRYWAEQVEAVRDLDQDGYRVVLWDAHSEDSDGGAVAAGVMQLPPGGIGLEELAFGLRDLLQRASGDPSISVTVADQDDEGGGDAEAWSRRSVAEFHQRNPYDPDAEDDPEEYEALEEYPSSGEYEYEDQDEEDGEPDPSHEEFVQAQVGPRKVGGRYLNAYWGQAYTVLAIDRGPRADWPVSWQITVLNDGEDEPVSHCTAWDERDTILSDPEVAAEPDNEDAQQV